MNKSESITELAKALCKAQGAMGGAHKGANNPFFKSKYADLSAVIQAIKEPFASNGLSYVQFPIESGGRVGIETILMHESGEFLSNEFTMVYKLLPVFHRKMMMVITQASKSLRQLLTKQQKAGLPHVKTILVYLNK